MGAMWYSSQTAWPPRHKYFFSCKEIYALKVKKLRETHETRSQCQTVWSKGAVSSPLSHFWHILCYYFVPMWISGVEGLILRVSLFWTLDVGPPLTAVPYIVCTQAVSRYIRTVPDTAKPAFLNNIVYESTCVCVCLWVVICVCPPVLSIMGGDSCGVCQASGCQ